MIGRRTPPPETGQSKPMGFDDFDLRLGDVMRGERATLGKSLLDVQRELKIKATYISAIENADPSAFETQGFVAGYVRSYARYLGLDPEWAFDRFCKEGNFETAHGMSPAASASQARAEKKTKPVTHDPLADPDAVFVPRAEKFWSRLEPGAIGSVLVLIMLISFIGYGGFSVFRAVQKVELAPVEQAPGVGTDISEISPGADVLAAADGSSGIDAPTIDALDRLYRPRSLDVPVMEPRDGPIASLDPLDVGTLAGAQNDSELAYEPDLAPVQADVPAIQSAPGQETQPVQVLASAAPDVVLFAVRPSWVRIQAADGAVIFEKILDAGEKYVLPKTQEPPLLRVGNAGSVYFTLNGVTYGPAGVGPSVAKNVVLSPEALKEKYAEADLSKDEDLARFVAVAQAEGASGN